MTMTPERARAVLAEAARRKRPSPLRQAAFPKQRAFLDDPARFKAALCTRRAGKSFGTGMWLCDAADRFPGTAQLYLGLTLDTVRRIMMEPVLKVLNAQFNLGATFVEKPMEMRFPNGSKIYLLGIDADENERKKVLGQKYKRVAIDECGSMTYDLDSLVTRYIRPTLVDLRGELLLAGTPENHRNYFYDITDGGKQGEFAVHRWSAFDNPYVAESWGEEIAELKRTRPGIEETPLFKQHYLGLWTVDTSALVYRYSRERNWVASLPRPVEDGHIVMGVDLGYNDATAVVIGVYFDHDPTLFIIEAHKRAKLTVAAVATWLRGFMERYSIERFVIDPASKQVVEELRQRYHLPLESAEKSGKVEAIAMMNSDLLTARIMVVGDACAALTDEWAGLVWDARGIEQGRYAEHSACENHCFVAGTLVETAAGPVAIEQVKPGDMVYTRAGLRRVRMAGCTGERETWQLASSSGATLVGTGNHPVFTDNGWVELSSLTPHSTLCEWAYTANTTRLSSTVSGTAGIPTRNGVNCASTTETASIGTFTERSMSPIMALSLMAGMSTTSTTTRSITTSKTSKRYLVPSTVGITCASEWPTLSRLLGFAEASTSQGRRRPYGMLRQKVARGILRMAGAALRHARLWIAYALSAGERSSQKRPLPRCAVATATTRSEMLPASTTSPLSALSAASPSVGISTSSPAVAPFRVRHVSKTGSVASVYNLSVDGDPEFFANGILVHNCSDAANYLWRAALNYAAAPPVVVPARGTEAEIDAWEDAEERRRGARDRSPYWERD